MKKMGRPTKYSPELVAKICSQLSKGLSLRYVCEQDDMPNADSVFLWLSKYKDFSEQYVLAKEQGTNAHLETIELLGDEAIRVSQEVDPKSSNAVVSAYKLKADNIKWVMSKMKPKKYGEKIDLTTNGKDIPAPIYGGKSANTDSQV